MMPYRRHRVMEKNDQSPKFLNLAHQIKSLNLDFFRDKVVNEKMTYFVTVEIAYDFLDSLRHSVDLSMFPILKSCSEGELTEDQRSYLAQNKKNISKAPPKLVSYHRDGQLTDFIGGVLYMCVHHSCKVVDVISIVEYECCNIMGPWLNFLQHKRADASSNIESKLYKNLANVISGKLHQVELTHSLNHSLTHSHTHSLTRSLNRWLTHSFARSPAKPLNRRCALRV